MPKLSSRTLCPHRVSRVIHRACRSLPAALLLAAPGVAAQQAAEPGPGHVYMLTEVTTQPRPTNLLELRDVMNSLYPAELRAAGRGGSVEVALVVGPDGAARDVQVVRSTDAAFDTATLTALRVLRFTPASVDGKPVAVRVDLPIRWQVAAGDSRIHELAEVDEPPVPSNVEATAERMARLYPPWLRAAGQGGTVTVRLHVDAQGAVVDARVANSTEPQLDPPSLHVARALTFTPAQVAGRPVAVWTEVPLQWETEKAVAEAQERDTLQGYELSGVEEQPRPLNLAELGRALERLYPPHLRDTRQAGSVHVRMRVDAEGVVTSAVVTESSDQAFNAPTVEAVRTLRFRPARVKGRPVAVWVVLPIQWQVVGPEDFETRPSMPPPAPNWPASVP
jgi:TonB family protein